MLENTTKTIIDNKYKEDTIDESEKEMKQRKVLKLINYINDRKEAGKFNKDDYILLEILNSEIKDEVLKQVELEF